MHDVRKQKLLVAHSFRGMHAWDQEAELNLGHSFTGMHARDQEAGIGSCTLFRRLTCMVL